MATETQGMSSDWEFEPDVKAQPKKRYQEQGMDFARLAGRAAKSKAAVAVYTFKGTAAIYAAAEEHLEGAGNAFLLAVQDIIPLIPGI